MKKRHRMGEIINARENCLEIADRSIIANVCAELGEELVVAILSSGICSFAWKLNCTLRTYSKRLVFGM